MEILFWILGLVLSVLFVWTGELVLYCLSGGNRQPRFDLYSFALDGNLMEKVTTASGFDGDPRFSPDGRWLVFVSQRNDIDPHEFNIFVADWLLQEE